MKKMILILVMMLVCLVQAADYWVDAADANSLDAAGNDGTLAEPFKTVYYATSRCADTGDTIKLKAGTHTESIAIDDADKVGGKSITIQGAGKTTTIIQAASGGRALYLGVTVAEMTSFTFKDLTIRGAANYGYDILGDKANYTLVFDNCVIGHSVKGEAVDRNAIFFNTNIATSNILRVINGSSVYSYGSAKYAFYLRDFAKAEVSDSNVIVEGIALTALYEVGEIIIDNSTITAKAGIFGTSLEALKSLVVTDSTLTMGSATVIGGYAIGVDNFAQNVLIKNNTISIRTSGVAYGVSLGYNFGDVAETLCTWDAGSARLINANPLKNVSVIDNQVTIKALDGTTAPDVGCHGILLGIGCDYGIVSDNVVDSGYISIVSKTLGSVVKGNICIGGKLFIKGAHSNKVYNNTIITGTNNACLQLGSNPNLSTGEDAAKTTYSKYNLIYDNIFQTVDDGAASYAINLTSADITNIVDYNCYKLYNSNKHSYIVNTAKTLATWQAYWLASGDGYIQQYNDAHSLAVDPRFKNTATGDYRPLNRTLGTAGSNGNFIGAKDIIRPRIGYY
jgi:hypothetical protein